MCSSFYGLGRLLPVGDESEEDHQRLHQGGGDLADMVRSSINGNFHQIWSLTNATPSAVYDEQQQLLDEDEENCVDHHLMSGCSEFLLHAVSSVGDHPFKMSPDLHQHHEITNYDSMKKMMADSHLPTVSNTTSMMQMIIKSKETLGEAGCGDLHLDRKSYLYSSPSCLATSSTTSCVKPPINCNVFSQMLHISSSTNDLLHPPSIVDHNKKQQVISSSQQAAHPSISSASFTLVGVGSSGDDTTRNCCSIPSPSCCDSLLHISSPRNPAIKRSRKSLAKKVVCIPAPAPANSRPSGEVVPSDLWAWRKYGQKPIKGSPYPRGYYRCSSSKGCSARKQVERSRTDPNMLVITYTSEHNHPWPTQRNALAGSTRSHPSKNISASSSWTGVAVDDQMKRKMSSSGDELKPTDQMVRIKQQNVDDDHVAAVQDYSNNLHDINRTRDYEEDEHRRCSYNKMTYRPRTLEPEEYNDQQPQEDDFFAELGEIAGKDHNGFSSFLMDWPSLGHTHDHDKAVI